MDLNNEIEFQALANLLTAAAVNKRLLMRVLAVVEHKELLVLHEEVAALDADFRRTIVAELDELRRQPPEVRLPEGAVPLGREEERRGHAVPNEDHEASTEAPIGTDHEARRASRPISS